MKKIVVPLLLLSLTACSRISDSKIKEVATPLIMHMVDTAAKEVLTDISIEQKQKIDNARYIELQVAALKGKLEYYRSQVKPDSEDMAFQQGQVLFAEQYGHVKEDVAKEKATLEKAEERYQRHIGRAAATKYSLDSLLKTLPVKAGSQDFGVYARLRYTVKKPDGGAAQDTVSYIITNNGALIDLRY